MDCSIAGAINSSLAGSIAIAMAISLACSLAGAKAGSNLVGLVWYRVTILRQTKEC